MSDALETCKRSISDFLAAARRFGGFGYSLYWALEEPYPLDIETELSAVWPEYQALAEGERTALRQFFDFGDMLVLFAYAARMATLAVRQNDPEHLRHALLAVSLGRDDVDRRDAAIIRVLLVDAARRLDAIGLIAQVAPFASDPMQWFYRHAERESRGLQSMRFVITEDPHDGFRYRSI